ncbi:zinc finger protein Xfin-like isoform X2 [Scaptodrosophila lebanonensis]|uniref:Zinc finger protein Xfin-like isoform X2 n=1 Tax=Drosophila lebanonensis TaxID=7225 RepID=A0A6J2TGH3_DROLE|nr:zinc finger protein Xfin-like isoform X2 [Scaptodrosophila lebanonensis]
MDFSTEQRLNYLLTDQSLNYMACQPICRLCGEFIHYGAENIFVKGGGVLRHHIEWLTGLWLEDIPNMPDQICIPCSFDLDQAVAFRERCISTQLRLLKDVLDNSERTNIVFEIYEPGESGKSPDPATTNGSQIHESTDYIGVWDNPEDGIGHTNPPQIVGEATIHQRRIRKRKHVCEKCRRKFDNTEFYEKHLLRHLANGRFHCKLCDLKYDRKCDFARHLRSLHERKELFPCRHDKCNEKFTSQTYRLKHEKRHLKRVVNFYCKLCDRRIKRKHDFVRHIRVVHKDKKPDESVNNSGEILNPLQNGEVATTEGSNIPGTDSYCDKCGCFVKERFHCKLCDRRFALRFSLVRHIRFYCSSGNSGQCKKPKEGSENLNPIQNENVTTSEQSQVPKRGNYCARCRHSEIKYFSCKLCDRGFDRKDDFVRHVDIVHKDKKPDDICNVELRPQSTVSVHETSNNSGECNKPEEGSEYSNSLQTEYKHEIPASSPKDKKPDDICNISQTEVRPQSNRLDNGSSDDSGKCNKPEEGSEYSNPLQTEYKHEIPAPSPPRERKLTFKTEASEHSNPLQTADVVITRRTQIRKKKYLCGKCRQRFGTRESYEKHLLLHSKYGRFHCKLCDLRYERIRNFERHMQLYHKVKNPDKTCNMQLRRQPNRFVDESSDNSDESDNLEEGSE